METTGRQRTGEPGSVESVPGPDPDDLTLRVHGVVDAAAVRRLEVEIRRIVAPGHPGAQVVVGQMDLLREQLDGSTGYC